jgi:NADH:ubiquinone oxidoreductase subunit B-like Fe-S oxidoreductase
MGLEATIQTDGYIATTIDAVVAWARKSSLAMPCRYILRAIEMIAAADPKYEFRDSVAK